VLPTCCETEHDPEDVSEASRSDETTDDGSEDGTEERGEGEEGGSRSSLLGRPHVGDRSSRVGERGCRTEENKQNVMSKPFKHSNWEAGAEVNSPAPNRPPKNRVMRMVSMFWAQAPPMLKRVKRP
jgi:hypothetical protein